jgi:hypothetical protein
VIHVNGTEMKGALDVLANISFIAWMPVAWFEWRRGQRRERDERLKEVIRHDQESYAAIDTMYVEFLKVCFEHPYLDVFDIADERPVQLTPAQRKEERIALAMLGSLFEHAFLLHSYDESDDSLRQWAGWEAQIREYFKRKNFREAWHIGVASYDPRFEAFMEQLERETELTSVPASASAPAPAR